ncbi:hypothetical protein AB0M29_04495 [Streptomyces sp. NPDC051976]|uniref:hypothetical protein n=1 Tax=Streptomyces sp. NPDC051976 TaxID=3154947 RepID=UPI0034404529
MKITRKRALLAAALGASLAVAGTTTTASAYSPVAGDALIYSTFAGAHCGVNGESDFTLGDGNLQSLVTNMGWTQRCDSTWWGGYGPGIQDLALCMRRDGGEQWYESTIIAYPRDGHTSHYDCANNGTYDRGLVGVGVHYDGP